jgi:fucose permease
MANLLLAIIYLAFVSLGLPDPLLGAAWPMMGPSLGVPMSWAGGISFVIAAGTIVSALNSDRLTRRIGAGKVTAYSVLLTAIALFGFSLSTRYWMLILFAIPYGLGAGGVDAALNNYVALHYASKHMSWLHAMWGVGTLIGPMILSFALSHQLGWRWGYRSISIIQVVLTIILFASLPLWIRQSDRRQSEQLKSTENGADVPSSEKTSEDAFQQSQQPSESSSHHLSFREVMRIPGALDILIMFFCYCTIEQTSMLWASSYMTRGLGMDKAQAAGWAALFTLGITIGRFANGFLAIKFSDPTLIRMGEVILALGMLFLLLPIPGTWSTMTGFILVGLGCAPVYPCVIHSTPTYFGADKSQEIIGLQMAFAYTGTLIMPPLFGILAQATTVRLLPWYLLIALVIMAVCFERLRATYRAQRA